ncbi:MAG: two-component system response regulator [Gemmatimonadales bacterium]
MAPCIVIADDEPDLRKLLRARLVRSGFDVLEADNGLTALELVRRHRPAAAILDFRMPGMNGGEVCGLIKADPELRGTPVILVTATSQSIGDEPSPTLEADDIVIKPFDFTDFYRRLQRLLSQPISERNP